MDQTPEQSKNKVCSCSHHKVLPFMIILIGLIIILGITNVLSPMWTWIIVGASLIVIGATKLFEHACTCC